MSDIFDKDELMERIDNDFEFLAETLEIYKNDYPELISQMRKALSQQDLTALGAGAHTLKGLVSNFAAHAPVEAAAKLEVMAKQGGLSEAEQALASLEHECNRLKDALEELVQQS